MNNRFRLTRDDIWLCAGALEDAEEAYRKRIQEDPNMSDFYRKRIQDVQHLYTKMLDSLTCPPPEKARKKVSASLD